MVEGFRDDRVRPTSSENVGSPSVEIRNTIGLTRNPSARSRPG